MRRLLKRVPDLLLTVPLAVLTAPVVAAAAIASVVSYRAWPFFCQERLGLGGQPFLFLKIRTLPPETPAYIDKYALSGLPISRVGRFLRKTHIDELPQLWHVMSGKMSLVGPRPEMPSLARTFSPDFVAARTMTAPGVTGVWQISEDCDGLIGEAPEYDLWYLEHQSFRLDAWVLWQTARQVLMGAEPITFDELSGMES